MRLAIIATIIILVGCNTKKESGEIAKTDTLKTTIATTAAEQKLPAKDTLPPVKTYSNKRFKEVSAEKIGKD